MAIRDQPEYALLASEQDRAERRLNLLRAVVVGLLAVAAGVYAPALSRRVNLVNAVVLAPMMTWTAVQYAWLYRRTQLPGWLSLANPIADVLAITVTIGGYGLEATPSLGLKSPMLLAYFVILAGRPIASSVRMAGVVATLIVVAYASLDLLFIGFGGASISDPIIASTSGSISLLDEGTKLVLLAMVGALATYATWWHERMAFQYAIESRERELLQSSLVSSRLESLKQQLRPHFLFNALNSIAAQVETEPAAAQQTIAGLGALIRASLEGGGDHEVKLEEELRILSYYIAIQTIRFGERLTVVVDADEDAKSGFVPALILQPLVENAIVHGIQKRSGPGRITVRAQRLSNDLLLCIADDGPGLEGRPVESIRQRIGVGNTRARLTYLYGENQSFNVSSPPDGGFTVSMSIPFRTMKANAQGL